MCIFDIMRGLMRKKSRLKSNLPVLIQVPDGEKFVCTILKPVKLLLRRPFCYRKVVLRFIPPYPFIEVSGLIRVGIGFQYSFNIIVDLIAGHRKAARPVRLAGICVRENVRGAFESFVNTLRLVVIP